MADGCWEVKMRKHLPLLALLALAGCSPVPKDIVHVNPQYLGPDEIVRRAASASRMEYAFRGERGIYSFDISPPPRSVKQVTFVFKDQRALSSLSIQPSEAKWIELYVPNAPGHSGVEVIHRQDDWYATFSGDGLDLLRQGGRFQVIDVYRE